MDACIRGDSRMQKVFYYQYYPILMRICIRYSANVQDAEQWVHDAFLKIFDALPEYSFKGSFEGYIKKIATRVCLDNIRKKKTLRFETENNIIYPDDFEEISSEGYIDNDIISKIDAEDLLWLINQISDKPRIVFNMYIIDEYPFSEIAYTLDIKENYAYWLLHQAKKELKLIFQKFNRKEVYNESK